MLMLRLLAALRRADGSHPLGWFRTTPDKADVVLADKAYSSRAIRDSLSKERCISRLKPWRGIATRYE